MINHISQERYAQPGGDPGQTLDILEGLQLPPNPAEHHDSLSGGGNCCLRPRHKQAEENKRNLLLCEVTPFSVCVCV